MSLISSRIKSLLKQRARRLLWMGGVAIVTLSLAVAGYVGIITNRIDERIRQLHEARGTHFYALYPALRVNTGYSRADFRAFLEDQGYSEKKSLDELLPGDYAIVREGGDQFVYLYRLEFNGTGHPVDRARARIKLEEAGAELILSEIYDVDGKQSVDSFPSRPKRIAAYVAGRLRSQSSIALSEIPVSMRLAIMAIEDVHFLEHSGVSLRSTLRAMWKDLRARKFVEGGSTITQQLMKNLFFSREKAVSRKLKEALFAFVTESRHSKEAILEAYLNEVYLGQMSTHEIHGVSEGARYYFNRPVSELTIGQSALLAAIVQAPGVHDPRRYPDRATKRRNTVLKKMLDAEFILQDEYQKAVNEPLAVISAERSLDDADYFMDLAMERLPSAIRSRLDHEAMSVYTTLNPYLQSAASRLLKTNIDRLQKLSPSIRDREKKGMHLQGALIAVSVKDGSVLALQGGKSYRQTQFNRVLHGKRQPGSLFKPFVMLTAFENPSSGQPITPITELSDAPFEWKYEGQSWKPRNYDNEHREKVSVRQALEQSINVPTARLASLVGLSAIRDNLIKAGIKSNLPSVPSLSLGSAEVTPIELAEAFATVANLGISVPLRPFVEVFDEMGNLVHTQEPVGQPALSPGPTFLTVQLMKGVFSHGTARSALASGLYLDNFAGKTGTTNDAKDAWFVGFSPTLLTLIWVGYDEEEKVGVSGSVAALPLWVEFIRRAKPFLTEEDFATPDGVLGIHIDPERGCLTSESNPNKRLEYFIKGTEPTAMCP